MGSSCAITAISVRLALLCEITAPVMAVSLVEIVVGLAVENLLHLLIASLVDSPAGFASGLLIVRGGAGYAV